MDITIIGCGEVGYVYAEALSNLNYTLQICAPRLSSCQISALVK